MSNNLEFDLYRLEEDSEEQKRLEKESEKAMSKYFTFVYFPILNLLTISIYL